MRAVVHEAPLLVALVFRAEGPERVLVGVPLLALLDLRHLVWVMEFVED